MPVPTLKTAQLRSRLLLSEPRIFRCEKAPLRGNFASDFALVEGDEPEGSGELIRDFECK